MGRAAGWDGAQRGKRADISLGRLAFRRDAAFVASHPQPGGLTTLKFILEHVSSEAEIKDTHAPKIEKLTTLAL